MSWQLLTATSVIAFSVSVLIRRMLLHEDKSDPIATAIVYQLLTGIFTGIYAVFHGFHPPDLSKYWLAVLITIVLYAAGNVIAAKTLQIVEASVFSVLFATSAIWTILASLIVFNDKLTVVQVVGIFLVFIGIAFLVEKKSSLKLDRGNMLGLLAGLVYGLAITGWAYIGRRTDVPTWTSISFLGPALVILAFRPSSVLKMKSFLTQKIITRMLLLGIIFSISALAALFAYKNGNVSSIAALQQTSIIVTTILGIIFLHERKHLLKKITSAIICLAGVVLIVK